MAALALLAAFAAFCDQLLLVFPGVATADVPLGFLALLLFPFPFPLGLGEGDLDEQA